MASGYPSLSVTLRIPCPLTNTKRRSTSIQPQPVPGLALIQRHIIAETPATSPTMKHLEPDIVRQLQADKKEHSLAAEVVPVEESAKDEEGTPQVARNPAIDNNS